MDKLGLKQGLHALCMQELEQRIHAIQEAISAARAASNEDTKSSAGDKYETGRAMAQLEIDKQQLQLAEAQQLKQVLSTVPFDKIQEQIAVGSVLETLTHRFYIAVAIGKIDLEGESYQTISAQSPLAKALWGKKVGDSILMNGNEVQVKALF